MNIAVWMLLSPKILLGSWKVLEFILAGQWEPWIMKWQNNHSVTVYYVHTFFKAHFDKNACIIVEVLPVVS